jgi:hypothetical protein
VKTVSILNLGAVVCFGAAGYLAVKGVDGWGWFLFVGLLCGGGRFVIQ